MKRVVRVAMVAAVILVVGAASCSGATSDKKMAKRWARNHYPGYRVVFVQAGSSALDHRAGKKVVYIESLPTVANGGRYGTGRTQYGKFKVKYTKRVKKGRRCLSYAVYSPKSNSCDDVVAFIDHGKIRR